MNVLAFAVFTVVFLALCYLHLAPALGVLRNAKHLTSEMDPEYVRIENFNAGQVRAGKLPSDYHSDFFPSSLQPGAAAIIHVQGDCFLAQGVRARGVVSDGALTMEAGSEIEQFADCRGPMTVGRNCTIGGPATSAISIALELGAKLRCASAPEIRTTGPVITTAPRPSQRLTIPAKSQRGLHQLSADSWIWKGPLCLAEPILVKTKLIVIGSFTAAAGSELLDDVKASGDIRIGGGSVCRGNLICGGNMTLSEGVRFEGALHASGTLFLGAGVEGGAVNRDDLNHKPPRRPVAYGTGVVTLGPGIVIRGKVVSDKAIQVVV